jgi:hypothetical protein
MPADPGIALCVGTKRRKCDKKAVRKQYIEDEVIHETMKMLHDEPVVNQIVDTLFEIQSERKTMLPLLEKQLAETEKSITNMLNAIQSGIFTESTKQRLEELEQSKKDTEIALIQEKITTPEFTKEQFKFWICKWRDIDTSDEKERQKLIDIFVNSIYVYDGEAAIMFNRKDGEKRIRLDDVNASRTKKKKASCSDSFVNGSPTLFKDEP